MKNFFAVVISKDTGKVWDCSVEQSSGDEGDGIHAYLGVHSFDKGAVDSLGLQPFNQHALADGGGPLSDGKVTDVDVFSMGSTCSISLLCVQENSFSWINGKTKN